MDTIILLAQIVGVLAVITFFMSYQLKRRKHIIAVNATSSALYVLQYIMLGAFEGAALDVLSAISTVAAHNKDKGFIAKHTKIVFILICLVIVMVGLALYKDIFSLFPIVGTILQSGAFWIDDEKTIRLVSFLGAPFWLVYNITSHAYGSVIGSVLCIFSIGIAIWRYDIAPYRKGAKNHKDVRADNNDN